MSLERRTADVDIAGHRQELKTEPNVEERLYENLCRLFGGQTAEYFLNPDLENTPVPSSLGRLIDQMGGQVSAQKLWRMLREESSARLARRFPVGLVWNDDNPAANAEMCGQRHMRRLARVRRMFQTAQLWQAQTAELIAKNPLSPPCESTCGSATGETYKNTVDSMHSGRGHLQPNTVPQTTSSTK